MPWSANDYPSAMKNLSPEARRKAIEIANAVLAESGDEGKAIAIGISKAREHFDKTGTARDTARMSAGFDGHTPTLREATLGLSEDEETQRSEPQPAGGTRAFAPGPPA